MSRRVRRTSHLPCPSTGVVTSSPPHPFVICIVSYHTEADASELRSQAAAPLNSNSFVLDSLGVLCASSGTPRHNLSCARSAAARPDERYFLQVLCGPNCIDIGARGADSDFVVGIVQGACTPSSPSLLDIFPFPPLIYSPERRGAAVSADRLFARVVNAPTVSF